MRAIAKLTVAALVGAAITAVVERAIHTLRTFALDVARDIDATGTIRSQAFADWQGALTQSFEPAFSPDGAPDGNVRRRGFAADHAHVRRHGEDAGPALGIW